MAVWVWVSIWAIPSPTTASWSRDCMEYGHFKLIKAEGLHFIIIFLNSYVLWYSSTSNLEHRQIIRDESRRNESLQIKVGNKELKEFDHIGYLGSVDKRYLLYKGSQDENYHSQRIVQQKNITVDKLRKTLVRNIAFYSSEHRH